MRKTGRDRKRASVKKDAYIEKINLASTEQIEAELKKENYKHRYRMTIRSTISILLIVCAVSMLIATFSLPVMKIYGTSMEPTLKEGQIVVSVKDKSIKQGDVVGIYYGNKVLIKRCIATSGQWVKVDKNGDVYVDDMLLTEPYVSEKVKGDCSVEFPMEVPDGNLFLMGDKRSIAMDSRNQAIGCMSSDDTVGRIIFRIWPLSEFGKI